MYNIIEIDASNTCFICGIDRKDFEKQEKKLQTHKNTEHDVWNYIYFMIYLTNLKSIDMSGVESYVDDRVKSKSAEWIPQHSTLYLGMNGIII